MKRILLFMFSFSFLMASAQDRIISGRVTSSEDGLPVPGVNILVKGTATGTSTDADGKYSISIPPSGVTLVFSYLGHVTQEIEVGTQSSIDVLLKSDLTQLNEVVVIGYATAQKRELTGAVSSIKGGEIKNMPVQSFDKALQGRVAGVQVLSANGVPGGAVSVRIRGVGSITAGNEPLYIVDGVQMNTRNDGGSRVSNNPLAFLNPNDIESIDVLKDAANASIYGAQAANGVVIVTTKKGKAGGRTNFNASYYKGIVEPMPSLKMMNTQQFIQIRQEALKTSFPALSDLEIRQAALGGRTTPSITGLGLDPGLTDEQIAALPTYDWQGEAFKPGSIDNYELSMSGGNESTTFYTSLAVNKQDASIINVDFQRIGGKVDVTQKVNKRVSVNVMANLSSVKQRGPYGDARGTTAFGAAQYAAPVILPLNPIYDAETGGYYGLPGSGDVLVGDLSQNVIATSMYIDSWARTNQMVSSLALNYTIIDNLVFRAFGAIDYRHLHSEFYGDPRLNDYYSLQGTKTVGDNVNANISTNYTLNYNHTFGTKHNVNVLAGFEYRNETNETSSFAGQGFPSPDFNTGNAAATPTGIGGAWTGFKRVGLFSNLKYDYDKRYFASLTLRYDGSSRFGSNNQFGYFPSVSGAWNINEEPFLKSSNLVSDLRLRASWGTTGNDQIGNFDSRSLYGLVGNYNGASGIGPSQLGNPNLRWEKNETTNIGVDYGFFNNRIAGSVEVFRRISRDLLLNQSVAQTSGFNDITKNVGELKNDGLEIEIRTININKNGFEWNTNFNITFLDNEVLSLYNGLQILPGDQSIRVGYPLGTNINNPYAGVNPANGRPMHYDKNGNITYLRTPADLVPMGHQDLTTTYGGFTNTFSYKGIELSAFFQFDYGRTAANLQHFRMADNGAVLRNSNLMFFEDRWTTPGQVTYVPRPANNRTENSSYISSYQTTARFYEDASFIRLKQVTLAYNLPASIISRLKFNNARIYAQGVNLITWTKWTGYDPEFRATGNGTEGIIPQVRNYIFGIEVGF